MKWYHYELLRTSSKKPNNTHNLIETSSGHLYIIDSSDLTKVLKSEDKGESWSTIATAISGYNYKFSFQDRSGNYLFVIMYRSSPHSFDVTRIDLSDDSTGNIGSEGGAGSAMNVRDVVVTGNTLWSAYTHLLAGVYYISFSKTNKNDLVWGGTRNISCVAVNPEKVSQMVDIGSYYYFLWRRTGENVKVMRWTIDTTTLTTLKDCGANTELPSIKQRAIAYDGSDILYFVLQDTSDSKYYLYDYVISTDTLTKHSEYNIALMLDRNMPSGVLEKAFHITEYKVYQIRGKVGHLFWEKAVKFLDDTILAITNNFLFTNNGKLYEYSDQSSKIANCIIWSPMYQGSKTPRPFGYPKSMPYVNWDKRYQMCLIRVGASNEAYFQEKDMIEILDPSGTTSFFGRITTKQDRLTSYILWCYSWGDELMESIFPNAYANKKMSEIITGQINASSKSTIGTIDATTTQMYYNVAKPDREIIDLGRYMDRAVFWRVPGYDGKCYFDKDITDVNILPDSGETWTESTAGINYLGKMSYAFGITRAHVWGAKNSKEQVNKKSAITAEEQEIGVVGIFPFIDTALTNYTEVNQLATALKNIYSTSSIYINIRAHSKGFLQWGHRVNFQWDVAGKLPTADDYMILEWIYDAKNDVYLRFIATNNTVFEREFINVQKQLGKDVYISADYIDVSESESTSDGTVLPQYTLAELRARQLLDEDNMVSDDDTAVATQQSIKAYVDSRIATGYYTGNSSGAQRTITSSLNFTPKMVQIMEPTMNMWNKWDSMPTTYAIQIRGGGYLADAIEIIANGFKVAGATNRCNVAPEVYRWVAIG